MSVKIDTIEVFDKYRVNSKNTSSKGNQPKWRVPYQGGYLWVKQDYLGYEGLVEVLVSRLLECTVAPKTEGAFIKYYPCHIKNGDKITSGCYSFDFLDENEILVTLPRLLRNESGVDILTSNYMTTQEEISEIVGEVSLIPGLSKFGWYLSNLLKMDATVYNEDRHYNNITVIHNTSSGYRLTPMFDFGAGLLSDTIYDYPQGDKSWKEYVKNVKAKPFSVDFEQQLKMLENPYKASIELINPTLSVMDLDKYYRKEDIKRAKAVLEYGVQRIWHQGIAYSSF